MTYSNTANVIVSLLLILPPQQLELAVNLYFLHLKGDFNMLPLVKGIDIGYILDLSILLIGSIIASQGSLFIVF